MTIVPSPKPSRKLFRWFLPGAAARSGTVIDHRSFDHSSVNLLRAVYVSAERRILRSVGDARLVQFCNRQTKRFKATRRFSAVWTKMAKTDDGYALSCSSTDKHIHSHHPSPHHSLIPGLKPSFSANPSHRIAFFFYSRTDSTASSNCLSILLSISVLTF